MNVPQALEHANAFFFPELVYGSGFQAMDSERQKNEEAMATLREEFAKNDNPAFGFDIIRDLADRNRDLCDQMGSERLNNTRDSSLARGMSDDDLCGQVAALQKRKKATVIREVHGDRNNLGVAYVTKPIKGTVLGIDIETTDRYPDRGYIINVGFELMDLTPDAEPYDPEVHFCGIPEMYREKGVPLERIHHITWADLDGQTPFRENKALQAKILKLMKKYPYMAHNAAFEDSWFTLHLDGYAEARKAGKIVPIDTRDICRQLDPEVKTLPRESSPASLENWARRRGTLQASENEVHQGLDDTNLMLKTVQAEFNARNCFKVA
ncbi:3'-5' exonuclease [uncultured Parolsenella sp.]|uniref:3'-5' exonuclease n=1 Tax=uncultured Parolsenella sp. TaxID=2083008 RepID=UPI0027DD9674|nr:3'-5' exonuclease [uncultured Parolsenella sp.]